MHYMDIVLQSEETIPVNIFLFRASNRNTRKWCELYSELTIKILDNVDFDIKSLLNDCWSIFKMLFRKCCPPLSNFYWHNDLMYNPILNKNAGDTFMCFIIEKCNQ